MNPISQYYYFSPRGFTGTISNELLTNGNTQITSGNRPINFTGTIQNGMPARITRTIHYSEQIQEGFPGSNPQGSIGTTDPSHGNVNLANGFSPLLDLEDRPLNNNNNNHQERFPAIEPSFIQAQQNNNNNNQPYTSSQALRIHIRQFLNLQHDDTNRTPETQSIMDQLIRLPTQNSLHSLTALQQLTSLPTNNLSLNQLSLSNLPSSLINLPLLHTGFSFSGNHQYDVLLISKTQLEKSPGQLFSSLHSKIMKSRATYLMIHFIDDAGNVERGSDMGGLSREFLSKLFKGIVSEKKGPLVFEENMPLLKGFARTNDEERHGYEVMGRLMGLCINEPTLRTGLNFPPAFFSALREISEEDAQKGPEYQTVLKVFLALDPDKEIAIRCMRSKDLNGDGLKTEALNWAFPDGAPVPEPSQPIIQQAIFQNLKAFKRVAPFFSIVEGLLYSCEVKGIKWDTVRTKSFIELSQAIQGVAVSKEKITLVAEGQPKVFFERWLDEATPEQLELFVHVATGSTSLEERKEMNCIHIDKATETAREDIMATEEDIVTTADGFHFGTCGKLVVMPHFESYERFKECWEQTLETFRNGGFTKD